MNNIILAEKIDVGYEKKVVVEKINLCGMKGQLICLLGPNGAGKSTILRTLSGLLAPVSGAVYINGHDLKSIKKKELAKKLAVVLTEQVSLGLLTVSEIAAMGRYPHTNMIGKLSQDDKDIANDALRAVNAAHLKDRYYAELSDGEKQKVMIARALIQQPEMIILDEPTSHLDIKHKVEVISILHRLCLEKGITVILSLHDIDLAIKGCETILLVQGGKITAQGTPEEIIKVGTIQKLYDIEGAQYNELLGSLEFSSPRRPEIFLFGGNGTGSCIFRALSRAGFGMYCGVLHSNDIDNHIGKALGCKIIEEEAFKNISEATFHQAREIMKNVDYIIDTGFPVGSINARNVDLIIEAIKINKIVISLIPRECAESRYGEWAKGIRYCTRASEVTKLIREHKQERRGTHNEDL